jgi:hypothetical protein
MSRIINEPVTVHLDKYSVIRAFIWRRRLYQVLAILSSWRESSRWWNDEAIRFLTRVVATNSVTGIYELCEIGGKWLLNSVLD